MHPLHVGVGGVNLALAAALAWLAQFDPKDPQADLAVPVIVGGYLANLLALAIAAFVLAMLPAKLAAGQGGAWFRRHGLAMLNGLVVLLAWQWMLAH